MAGKWNADRLTNKPPAPTKPSKPGAPQPSNQPKVLANERDVQAKFDDIRTEAIKIANNEGWSADEANAYVIKEMKTLGAEYHDYAMKNAKSIR